MANDENHVAPESANSESMAQKNVSLPSPKDDSHHFNFFELAPLAYFLFDFHHQLLDLNLMAAELLSLGRTQVLNKRFLTFVDREDRELFHQHLSDIFSTAHPGSAEVRLMSDLKGVRWVRLHSQLLKAEDGTLQCLTGAEDFTERKKAVEVLERNEAQLAAVYDSVPIMLCLVNDDLEVVRMNRAMASLVGPVNLKTDCANQTAPPCPGDLLGCIHSLRLSPQDNAGTACVKCSFRNAIVETLKTSQPQHQIESAFSLAQEAQPVVMHVLASTALVHIEGRRMVAVALEDITRRKQLEAQFLRSQRMEAVGELAGGVAHDFNNILSAVLMNLDLLRQEETSPEVHKIIESLGKNAHRATSLTRQLLLFSRREIIQAKNLDTNELLNALIKMLRRLLRENIEIDLSETLDSVWVHGDPGMIEQAVVNLCVNSGDAMPNGGRLSLRTSRVELTPQDAAVQEDARPGQFVRLTVADTGCGMDPATLSRAFEPFFTTKDAEKKTGLGLATVFGIVKQHQGWISVESTPGKGTTIHVFLPAIEPPPTAVIPRVINQHPGGSEGLFVIEDDPSVRGMVAVSLRRLGYKVHVARNATEAIQMWDDIKPVVDLILTDMILPEVMSGLDLIKQLRESKPGVKAIIFSGYSMDPARQSAQWPEDVGFIGKPFQLSELAATIRQRLG